MFRPTLDPKATPQSFGSLLVAVLMYDGPGKARTRLELKSNLPAPISVGLTVVEVSTKYYSGGHQLYTQLKLKG